MKNKTLIILISILFFVILAMIPLIHSIFFIDNVKLIKMDLEVGNNVGLNVDTDALHFGKVPAGNYGKRSVEIFNPYDRPTLIKITTGGELGEWVSTSENDFFLAKNENKSIKFTVDVPEDAELGWYYGEIKVLYLKPNNVYDKRDLEAEQQEITE